MLLKDHHQGDQSKWNSFKRWIRIRPQFGSVLALSWFAFGILLYFIRSRNGNVDEGSSQNTINDPYSRLDGLDECLRFHSKDCLIGIKNDEETTEIEMYENKENKIPCKHQILKELTFDIHEAMQILESKKGQRTNISMVHYFVYGSAIGLKRHGNVVPWTSDVDVAVLMDKNKRTVGISDADAIEFGISFNENERIRDSLGLFYIWDGIGRVGRICYTKKSKKMLPFKAISQKQSNSRNYFTKFNYADVYFEKLLFNIYVEEDEAEKKDPSLRWSGGPCTLHESQIHPPRMIFMKPENNKDDYETDTNTLFGDQSKKRSEIALPVPKELEKYLSVIYGRNWQEIPKDLEKHGKISMYSCLQ